MKLTINLADHEVEIVEQIISVYKLPLEYIKGPDESVTIDSDYFINCETAECESFVEGISYIEEAIDCDGRELFTKKIKFEDRIIFKHILRLVNDWRTEII